MTSLSCPEEKRNRACLQAYGDICACVMFVPHRNSGAVWLSWILSSTAQNTLFLVHAICSISARVHVSLEFSIYKSEGSFFRSLVQRKWAYTGCCSLVIDALPIPSVTFLGFALCMCEFCFLRPVIFWD